MNTDRHGWLRKGKGQARVALVAVLGILAILSNPANGQVIRLRTEATVEARQEVRLGDVATVEGGGVDRRTAEELANIVILSGVETSRKIRAEGILMALMAQHGGLAGGLQIGGAAECELKVAGAAGLKAERTEIKSNAVITTNVPDQIAPAPAAPVTGAARANSTPTADASLTLSKLIVARAQQELTSPAEDVRVTFNTISPLLDRPVTIGQKWLCRPLTRTPLGTVQFESQLVEGSKVIEKLTVQTKVERRQMVLVAKVKVDRGDIVTAGHVRLEEAWLDRNLPTLFNSQKEVEGLEAQRAVDIGAMLDQRDFKPTLMASKGDTVTVVYLAGTLKVQMRGRAMEDGKLHDQVEVRNESTGERYQAVMVGKRLAVVGGTLNEADEKKLREAL